MESSSQPSSPALRFEADEISHCFTFIEEALTKHPAGSDEDEEFREHILLDQLRNSGAPVTLVKSLLNRYIGGALSEYTDDLGEVVGLLVFKLKDDSCIPSQEAGARERVIAIADEAYKTLDEKTEKRPSSSIPQTVKEEANGDDAEMAATTKPRSNSGSSESSDSSAESGKSSSTSSSSKSRKEMNRLIEAKQYVSIDKIAQLFLSLEFSIRKRCERLLNILHAVSAGNEDECYVLSETFAPMFARPPNTAYMSIRHCRELPKIRLVLWVWIEQFEEISSLAREPYQTKSSSTPPPSSRHLLMHSIKPRLSSVSSGAGVPYSPPQATLNLGPTVLGTAEGENRTITAIGSRHVRRKTPPRVAALGTKRKVDMEHIEAFIVSTVDMLFSDIDLENSVSGINTTRIDSWITEEAGQGPSLSPESSLGGSGFSSHLAGKRQWATKERVIIEKRVLKKRLLHWDKEFEQKNNRKPTREDRAEMRGVFHAYGALKALLSALESPTTTPDALLGLEKRALQAVLRLFEKDFEERHGRKVEVAADIAGREIEYSRYKELKETLKAVAA